MAKPGIDDSPSAVHLPTKAGTYGSFGIHGADLKTVNTCVVSTNNASKYSYENPIKYWLVPGVDPKSKKELLIIWPKRLPTKAPDPSAGDTDNLTYTIFNSSPTGTDGTVTVIYNDDPPPTFRRPKPKPKKAKPKKAKPKNAGKPQATAV
jgi:hypothetical protein